MKERLADIIRLAYEINERFRCIYVSMDYTKGMGTLVTINNFQTGECKRYSSKMHIRDINLYVGDEYVTDAGFEKLYQTLSGLLKGGKENENTRQS